MTNARSVMARFRSDAIIYGTTTVLARGTTFLLVPILTRTLVPEAFGLVEVLSVIMTVAYVILSLEIGQALARFVPDETNRHATRAIASTALWFALAAYLTMSALLVLASLVLGQARVGGALVLAGATTAGGMFLLMQGQLRWELRPVPYAASSVVFAAVTVLATAGLVWVDPTVESVLLGQLAGAGAGIVSVLLLARGTFGLEFHRSWLAKLLRFSIPLVPASLGVLTSLYVDRLVIGALIGLDDVAWFSVGHRLASAVGLIMTAAQLALTPLIFAAFRQPEAPTEIADIFRRIVGLVLLLGVGLSLFAPEIVSVVATTAYAQAAKVIPFQIAAIVFAGLIVFAPGLWIAERTRSVALITIGGAVLNVLLNLALAPAFGIVGAALATLLSAIAVFGLLMRASQRIYRVPYPFLTTAGGALLAAIVIGASGILTGEPLPWPVRALLGIGAAGAFVALGLVGWPRRDLALRAV
jgi:O-antigen/teichoic acid export membrane protein